MEQWLLRWRFSQAQMSAITCGKYVILSWHPEGLVSAFCV